VLVLSWIAPLTLFRREEITTGVLLALLIRRRICDGELAFYRCFSPTPIALPTLVRVEHRSRFAAVRRGNGVAG
jgi:hypothetical protein